MKNLLPVPSVRLQENWLCLWKDLAKRFSKWQILQEDSILALKCPIEEYWTRYVWGTPQGNIETVKAFFDEKPFTWYLDPELKDEEKWLLTNGFEGPEGNPEMVINVLPSSSILPQEKAKSVDVQVIQDTKKMGEWLWVASEVFDTSYAILHDFITPFTVYTHSFALLATFEDRPVGTALLCQTGAYMGLYYVGVHPSARRRGIATQLLQKCMRLAQERKVTHILLYASPEGELLYKNFGFVTTRELKEYHFSERKLS